MENVRESIALLLIRINELFPEFSFSKQSLSLYVDSLEDVDFEKLKLAAKKYIKNNRTFPKPFDLIELAKEN